MMLKRLLLLPLVDGLLRSLTAPPLFHLLPVAFSRINCTNKPSSDRWTVLLITRHIDQWRTGDTSDVFLLAGR